MNTPQQSSNSSAKLDDILRELEERFGSADSSSSNNRRKNSKRKNKFSQNLVAAFALMITVVGGAAGFYLQGVNQELRQQAGTSSVPIGHCDDYNANLWGACNNVAEGTLCSWGENTCQNGYNVLKCGNKQWLPNYGDSRNDMCSNICPWNGADGKPLPASQCCPQGGDACQLDNPADKYTCVPDPFVTECQVFSPSCGNVGVRKAICWWPNDDAGRTACYEGAKNGNCDGGTTTPPDQPGQSSPPVATPAPSCVVDMVVTSSGFGTSDVPKAADGALLVRRGSKVTVTARIIDKAQGKISRIRFKGIDPVYARPDEFLQTTNGSNCTWNGDQSLDECSREYTVNPNMTSVEEGGEPRVKVEAVAEITGKDGNISSITCQNEVKMKLVDTSATATPVPTTPPIAGICIGIQMNNLSRPGQAPKVGDNINFTCGKITGGIRYQFRMRLPNEPEPTPLGAATAGGNVSIPYTVPNLAGSFSAQCSVCTRTSCSEWEHWPGQVPTPVPSKVPGQSSAPVTAPPTPLPVCNMTCGSAAQCQAINPNWTCYFPSGPSGVCRLASNPTSATCAAATPRPTAVKISPLPTIRTSPRPVSPEPSGINLPRPSTVSQ